MGKLLLKVDYKPKPNQIKALRDLMPIRVYYNYHLFEQACLYKFDVMLSVLNIYNYARYYFVDIKKEIYIINESIFFYNC